MLKSIQEKDNCSFGKDLCSFIFLKPEQPFNKYLLSAYYVGTEATMMNEPHQVSSLFGSLCLTGRRQSDAVLWGGASVLVQESLEPVLEVSLKLKSNYIFIHPHESLPL